MCFQNEITQQKLVSYFCMCFHNGFVSAGDADAINAGRRHPHGVGLRVAGAIPHEVGLTPPHPPKNGRVILAYFLQWIWYACSELAVDFHFAKGIRSRVNRNGTARVPFSSAKNNVFVFIRILASAKKSG